MVRGDESRKNEKYLIKPAKSSTERQHSLHNPSVIRSSGVSVPRTAITTDCRWCRTTTKYAAWHL